MNASISAVSNPVVEANHGHNFKADLRGGFPSPVASQDHAVLIDDYRVEKSEFPHAGSELSALTP
jgi:hypothetical protein